MTDLGAFREMHRRIGVALVELPPWQNLMKQYPHAVALEVVNTCSLSYGMQSVYFFDADGKFVTVGTWE
jgi:hypothetical protein